MLAGQRSRTKLSLGSVEDLGWIGNGNEVESLCRRGRAGGRIVMPLEQRCDVIHWAATEADVDQGSNEHPHHVVKEAISLDGEAHAATFRPKVPLGPRNSAAMVGLVSLCGEGAEIVLAQDGAGASLHCCEIEWASEGPLETTPERGRGSVVGSDVVPVSTGKG
jgi:hypothetical protein